MNNATNTLNKVKAVLGLEIKMEQLKMENGTLLEADKFEKGEPVFIVTEDEKVALPVGAYELEDNKTLIVEEEGIIASLGEHEVEEEEKKEEEEEKVEANYVTKEELESAVDEIKAMIEEVKAGWHEKKEDEEKEMGYDDKEEMSESNDLKKELSKPASQPFKHNPEGTAETKRMVRFATKRPKNTLDIIFEKFNNKK